MLGGARGGLSAQPPLARRSTADGAYARALRSVGARSAVPAQRSARSTGSRKTTYAGSGQAELVAYHAGPGLRLAWRVLAPVARDGDYDTLVDATDGRIARRANLVKFADALVSETAPGAHPGGTQTTKPIGQWLEPNAARAARRERPCLQGRPRRGRPRADRGRRSMTPFIPAVHRRRPGRPASDDWLYAVTPVADADRQLPGRPARLHVEPHGAGLVAGQPRSQATTQLLYFVNKFHDHLLAPPIGFNEAAGNFEQVNQSGPGAGGDPRPGAGRSTARTRDAGPARRNHSTTPT